MGETKLTTGTKLENPTERDMQKYPYKNEIDLREIKSELDITILGYAQFISLFIYVRFNVAVKISYYT
jgi:hypothetical protein